MKKLSAKQVGRNVITIIEGVKYSKKTVDNDEVASIKNKIDLFNKKPTKENLQKVIDIFDTGKEAREKQKLTEIGIKKVIKKTKKEQANDGKKLKAEKTKKSKALIERVKEFYKKKKIKDDSPSLLVVNKEGGLAMKDCEHISMPDLLVQRIESFISAQTEIKSLLNFWALCLLNPNEIARTKLFDYLQSNGLMITPSGYFVTYRMVKTTNEKGVFTDAHTKTMRYTPGTVCAIPRTECDEDGSRDCSKGLHTGTPRFIGIIADKKVSLEASQTVGDGYGITTKKVTPDSYDTGYDRPSEKRFDETFGNQAIICLINPMHVVSIPDSSTRKMRSCEFYFAKLTTPEEVIDMVEKDYLIFDMDYQHYELKQLKEMLKNKTIKAYINEKTKTGAKVARLTKELEKIRENIKLSNDSINNTLDLEAFKAIIKRREIVLK